MRKNASQSGKKEKSFAKEPTCAIKKSKHSGSSKFVNKKPTLSKINKKETTSSPKTGHFILKALVKTFKIVRPSSWKKFFLLFSSVFRSLFKYKVQISALIVLVISGGVIFSSLYSVNRQLNYSTNKLTAKSNQVNALIDLDKSVIFNDFDTINTTGFASNYLKGLRTALDSKTNDRIDIAYFDMRDFTVNQFNGSNTNCYFKVIPYDPTLNTVAKETSVGALNVSCPYLVKGNWPNGEKTDTSGNHYHEITVTPQFAAAQKLNINSIVTINNNKFWITGFADAPNFIYPQLTLGQGIPSNKTSSVIYTDAASVYVENKNIFNPVSVSGREMYIALHFISNSTSANLQLLNNIFQNQNNTYVPYSSSAAAPKPLSSIFPQNNANKFLFNPYSSNYNFHLRLSLISNIIKFNDIASYSFIIFALIITSILLFVIANKRIKNDRRLIGTFRALGYSNWFIFSAYTAYPFLIALVGILVGWSLGFAFIIPVTHLYFNFFLLPSSSLPIPWEPLLVTFGFTFLFLTLFTAIAFLNVARKSPINLLYEK